MPASFNGDVLITDFTGGELSPRWMSRVQGGGIDPLQGGGNISSTYQSGARDITNMIVLPQGGVTKRTGFLYARNLTVDIPGIVSADTQMYKFEYPGTDFLTVWTPLKVTVYATDTFDVNVPFGAPVASFTTPYTAANVKSMQIAQLQDTLIVFDGSHRMRILRLRSGVWTFLDSQDAAFISPAFDYRDQLSPPSTIANYEIELNVDKDRNAALWVSNASVDSGTFSIKKTNTVQTLTNITNALRTQSGVNISSIQVAYIGTGNNLLYSIQYSFLASVGDGSGILQAVLFNNNSLGVNEEIIVTQVAAGNSGGEPLWSGPGYTLKAGIYYQCIAPNLAISTNEPGVGVNQATFWTALGATLPTGTDWTVLYGGSPWALNLSAGPFNRGWPSTGTAHEQRLVANGPPQARGVIAGSRTGATKFLDFTVGLSPSDGFVFLLVVANGTSVVWLHSQKILYVGTSVGAFYQQQIPLTPTSVAFSRMSNYSLDAFRAFDVAGEVFYVQRNGRQMRRMQFIRDLESYQASDMTAYAEHLFTEGNRVRDVAYMNSPDTALWVLRTDGGLMSFTYERFYGCNAWAKHQSVGGTVAAIETFFGGVARKDMLGLLVARQTWNGSAFVTTLYLEVLAETSRNEWRATPNPTTGLWDYGSITPALWFSRVDATQAFVGVGGASTLSVDIRFRNKTVNVVENGIDFGSYLVNSITGVVNISPLAFTAGSTIYVGYNYPARIIPTALEVAAHNTAQSQVQRWARPMFRLFSSSMPVVNGQPIRERSVADLYDTVSGLYTGDVTIVNLGVGGSLTIEANKPTPFQMTGLFGQMSINSGDA